VSIYIVALGWDAMTKSSYEGADRCASHLPPTMAMHIDCAAVHSASISPIGMIIGGLTFAFSVLNFLRVGPALRLQKADAQTFLVNNLGNYPVCDTLPPLAAPMTGGAAAQVRVSSDGINSPAPGIIPGRTSSNDSASTATATASKGEPQQ